LNQKLTLEDKVLKLLPIGKVVQSKDLIKEMKSVGINNRISLERKLAELEKANKIDKIVQENPRKVFYRQNEYWRLEQLSKNFEELVTPYNATPILNSQITSKDSIIQFPYSMVQGAKNFAESISKDIHKRDGEYLRVEQKNDIAQKNLLLIVLLTLLDDVFKLKKRGLPPELKKQSYYIDEAGFMLPKSLVDSRISSKDVSNWRKKVLKEMDYSPQIIDDKQETKD
jgi:hypothetical protein